MASRLSPAEIAEKHARRTKGAVQDMIKGVDNVTVAPGQLAGKKEAKLIQNWNESVTSGRWKRGVEKVSLEEWKASMKDKGAQRVAAGIDAARGKVEAFYAELLPFQADLSAKVAGMPDLTIEDSIQRASTWIRGMGNFRKGGRTR